MSLRQVASWLRTIALLRHPEMRRALGALRFRQILLEQARQDLPGVRIGDAVQLVAYSAARFRAEPGTTVCDGTVLAFGDDANGYGTIAIGARTWVGQYNNLRASAGANVTIGADCLISQFCTLVGANHAVARDRPIRAQGADQTRLGVVLEDDIWLGAGVTVLPGVLVRRGAIVGANSVVTQSIPPYEIWAGCPARRIGARS